MDQGPKFTPAKPCCDACVLEAMSNAGFVYTHPFVVVSGLANQSKRSRGESTAAVRFRSGGR